MNNQTLIQLAPLVLLIVIMYFLLIRPQKKREKSIMQMRSSITIGDEIITIGGICGKIVKIKDEKVTIEVGNDKTKFEIMRWAISKVTSEKEKPADVKTSESSSKKGKVKRPSDKKEELKVDNVEPVEEIEVLENEEEKK